MSKVPLEISPVAECCLLHHTAEFAVSLSRISGGYVTKYAPHKALKRIT